MRRGKITVEIQDPIKVDPEWTLEELEKRLQTAIDPGDLDHPEFNCRSENMAEDMAKVVYRCPECRHFDSIQVIRKKDCRCGNCGMVLLVDQKYRCHITAGEKKTMYALHDLYEEIKITQVDIRAMQTGAYPDSYEKIISGAEYPVAVADVCELYQEISPRLELLFSGKMILTNQRILFDPEDRARSLQLRDIGSVTIESNNKVQ